MSKSAAAIAMKAARNGVSAGANLAMTIEMRTMKRAATMAEGAKIVLRGAMTATIIGKTDATNGTIIGTTRVMSGAAIATMHAMIGAMSRGPHTTIKGIAAATLGMMGAVTGAETVRT